MVKDTVVECTPSFWGFTKKLCSHRKKYFRFNFTSYWKHTLNSKQIFIRSDPEHTLLRHCTHWLFLWPRCPSHQSALKSLDSPNPIKDCTAAFFSLPVLTSQDTKWSHEWFMLCTGSWDWFIHGLSHTQTLPWQFFSLPLVGPCAPPLRLSC